MKSKNQQEFLLTFFEDQKKKVPSNFYEEKWVKGFWLVKQFNGDSGNWQVSVFTEGSFENYKNAKKINTLL